jgi:cytochrome c peroxidase
LGVSKVLDATHFTDSSVGLRPKRDTARPLAMVTLLNSRSMIRLTALTALVGLSTSGCEKEKAPPPTSKEATQAQAPKVEAKAQKHVDTMKLPKLGEMPIPEGHPQSDALVALGNRLFFEKRLSVDGSLSCYSCHQNEHGGGGATPLAVGAKEKKLTRHSPVIWNVGYLPAFYWDGRADSLEAQAKGAWGGGNMGVGAENLDAKAKEIAALPDYKEAFTSAFGAEEVNAESIARAISAYERTLVCGDTAYDRYAAGDKGALTDEQKDGLEIFMGKGMCTACHSPPHFSSAYFGEGSYFNVGVGTKGVEEKDVDVGRMKVSEDEKDWAAFKPPTLRNVSKSAPYFHDGSAEDLEKAVTFMASGGHDNKNKSPLMSDKNLNKKEIAQIISFLGALECSGSLKDLGANKSQERPKEAKPAQ